jgi:hypothetical protein
MKIVLSHISGSGDNIEEFMKKVDDDLSRMRSLSLPSNLSTLGQVLKFTKSIVDQFSKVAHLSSLNLIVNRLIEVIQLGTPDTQCIVDHYFQSLPGELFYEVSNNSMWL